MALYFWLISLDFLKLRMIMGLKMEDADERRRFRYCASFSGEVKTYGDMETIYLAVDRRHEMIDSSVVTALLCAASTTKTLVG